MKGSLTVEASLVMIIVFTILLALFLVMFELYHENVDYVFSTMKDYDFDAVSCFRRYESFRDIGQALKD